ncbi:hypothetical protein WDU94_003150 [Cyamophila willieti]
MSFVLLSTDTITKMSCRDEDTCQCDNIPVASFPLRRSGSKSSVRSSSCESVHSDRARGGGGSCQGRSSSSHRGGGGSGCDECGGRRNSSQERCPQCGKRDDNCICREDLCSNCGKSQKSCLCGSAKDACNKCGNFHEGRTCGKTSSHSAGKGSGCSKKGSSDKCGKSKCPDCGKKSHGCESKCGGGGSTQRRRCEMSRSRPRNDCGGQRSASRCDKSPHQAASNRPCGKSRDSCCGGKSSQHRSRADRSCGKHLEDEKCDICSKMGKRSRSNMTRQPSKCGTKVFRYDGRKQAASKRASRKNKRNNRDQSCGRQDKHRDKCETQISHDDYHEANDSCEEGESSGCEDLCPRCQQELGGSGGGAEGPCSSRRSSQHSMRSAKSTPCANLKPEPSQHSSCCFVAARNRSASSASGRSASCVSATNQQRSASCDSCGARSSTSCDACGGQKSADCSQQCPSASADNSGYILDENCPIHGTKATCQQPEKKQDPCGKPCGQPACQNKPQVRFSDDALKPPCKPATPHVGSRCAASKSRSRVHELTSAQCPVGHAACSNNTPGPVTNTGKTSRCSSSDHLACSTRNFTDSKLKFDLLFSNICETLSNEMYRIQMDPCITCCVPKYVTRGKSRSRRNVADASQCNAQDAITDATGGCEAACRKRKQTPCDDSPCCPEKDGCGKTG